MQNEACGFIPHLLEALAYRDVSAVSQKTQSQCSRWGFIFKSKLQEQDAVQNGQKPHECKVGVKGEAKERKPTMARIGSHRR